MIELNEFDRAYLHLVLEINKHIDGYIDAYLGPEDLGRQVNDKPQKSPALLLEDVTQLQSSVPAAHAERQIYLSALLRAVQTTITMIGGEDIPYMEEVQRIYDIMPQRVDEALFLRAHKDLDTLLPGSGRLSNRLEKWRNRYSVPQDKLFLLLELAREETQRRTAALVDLPPGEAVEVALVKDKPWSAYNWFKGQSRSLVEFNTDIPVFALTLASLFAHEGYPGHHTEGVLKEEKFWLERGYGESAAALLHSPAAVIAEGIATTAVEIIFPDDGHIDWTLDVLLPAGAIEPQESAEQLKQLQQALLQLRWVSGNAAMSYHSGQLTQEQTIEYLQEYGLATRDRAEKSLQFLYHPLYRSYVFTYTEGYNLIEQAAIDQDKRELFLSCLTEQKLPSQLAALAAQSPGKG